MIEDEYKIGTKLYIIEGLEVVEYIIYKNNSKTGKIDTLMRVRDLILVHPTDYKIVNNSYLSRTIALTELKETLETALEKIYIEFYEQREKFFTTNYRK